MNVPTEGCVLLSDFPDLPHYGIYVFSAAQVVIRVGESTSGKRLSKGFREPLRRVRKSKERKNYLAYQWRDKYRGMSIDVEYFDLKNPRFSDSHLRRALEAELTFQFRIANRAWPSEMSEIHFLEKYRTDSLLIATCMEILRFYKLQFNAAV